MTRVLAPLGLLVLYAAACGLGIAGPTGAGLAAAGVALAVTLAACGAGYGVGRLRARDPLAGWSLSQPATAWTLGLLGVLPLLAGAPGFAVPLPLAAGYLWARRSLHASDVLLLSVVAAVVLAFPFQREAWDALPLAVVPALLVAAALGLREAWDVGALHDAARALQSPLRDGADPAPGQARAATLAKASAWLLVGGAALAALGIAALRASAGTWRGGSAALLLVLAVAGFGGVAWLQRRA